MKSPPDPFYGTVFFDSCAFDGGNQQEKLASVESRSLFKENGGDIKIVHSVQKEIEFPDTPQTVKNEASQLIYTIEVQHSHEEVKELREVERIIVGDGSIETRKADCRHVFEAIKYGRYFVTTDKGILKHYDKILARFSTLFIVKPSEFLDIINKYTK